MTSKRAIHKLLEQSLAQATKAANWLKTSFQKSTRIDLNRQLSEDDFDILENLTSRFARYSDILVQKVFRLIDQIELETSGSVIDTLNRAAKRGLADDEEKIVKIRVLRNAISHEYTEEELISLFREVRELTPALLSTHSKTVKYCKKLLDK